MDLSVTLPIACAARCAGCPHPARHIAPAASELDGVLDSLRANAPVERLYVLGGDMLRRDALRPLLGALSSLGAAVPDTYLYAPLAEPPPLDALRRYPFVRGFVVPFLLGPQARHRGAPAIATVLERAIAASQSGLEVLPYTYLGDADGSDLPKLVAALGLRLYPEELWVRVVGPTHVPVAELSRPLRLAAEASLRHGIRLRLDVRGVPPCADRLYADHPALFDRLLRDHDDGSPNDATAGCARCALARRCRWREDDHVARFGAEPLVPIEPTRARHVREHDPVDAADVSRERWFVRRSELPAECLRPWTTIELMGIEPRRAAVCDEDWVRVKTPRLEGGSLIEAWNGPYFLALRRAHADGKADEVCRSHCLLRARRRSEPHAVDEIVLEGKREPFVRNLLATYRAMLSRALEVESWPIELAVGPTYRCNHACIMCHSNAKRRAGARPELPPSFYDELHDHLPTLRDLHVSGPGEPLLSKPFVAFLCDTDWAPYPDLRLHLTTNGTLLLAPLLSKLERVPFQTFIVSLNAATADTYRQVTGRDHFTTVIQNLRRLRLRLHAFEHRRPIVQLSFVVLRSNYRELPTFLELVQDLRLAPLLVPIECDQHNASEALWQAPDDLEEALSLIDDLRHRWHRRARVVHHLSSLHDALSRQRRERHQKRV